MAAGSGTAAERTTGTAKHTPQVGDDQPANQFAVMIRAGDRRTLWGHFADKPAADSVAGKLRRHGFDAVVVDRQEVTP